MTLEQLKKLNEARKRRQKEFHGDTDTPLYRRWCGILYRCKSTAPRTRRIYLDRGITVCEEWQKYSSFKDWALKNGWRQDLAIDRIDGNKGYSPDNCRWVTPAANSENRSATKLVTWNGQTMTINEWSKLTGVPAKTIRFRIWKGIGTLEQALTSKSLTFGRIKTHCKRGHAFGEENNSYKNSNGSQVCRLCRKTISRRHYLARKLSRLESL